MSGSGGEDVRVTIGANTGQFTDATQTAANATTKLAASLVNVSNVVASGRSSYVRAGSDVSGLAQALLKAGVGAADVAKYLGISTTAADTFATAARSVTSAGQSIGSLAVPADQAAAAAARLEATIARVMSGMAPLAATVATADKALAGIAQTGAQSAGQLDTAVAASKRLEDAARRVLAGLSPAAIEVLRLGTSARASASALDSASDASRRLDEATRQVMASLSPAAIAMLRTRDGATQMGAAMSAGAGVATTAMRDAAGASIATAASAQASAQSMTAAATAVAATSAPLKTLSFDYANLASQLLLSGASAKEVSAAIGMPIQKVDAFAAALRNAMQAQRASSEATQQDIVLTREQTEARDAAIRLDATVARTLANLATERRRATDAANANTSADNTAASAAKGMGSANQQAGDQLISAGSKFASAGQNVTALYHALIAAGDSAEAAAKKLGLPGPKLDEVDDKAKKGGHSFAGMARESVVLGRELLSTDVSLSRVVGTLAVMAERSGGLMTKIGELASKLTLFQATGVAAVLAVSAEMALFVTRALSAARAMDDVTTAAARMGRSTGDAVQDTHALTTALSREGMGAGDIQKVATMGATVAGVTREMRMQAELLAPALRSAYPSEPVEKYMGAIFEAMKGGVSGVEEYLRASDLLNDTNIRELASAKAQNDRQAAINILIRDTKASLDGYNAARAQQIKDSAAILAMGPGGEFLAPGAIGPPKLVQSIEAEPPKQVQDTENEEKLLGTLRERAALQAQIPILEARANTSTGEANVLAVEALKNARDKLAVLKDAGDATWLQKQNAALDAILEKVALNATSSKTIALDENQARIKFWGEQVTQAGLTEGQITVAQNNASRARRALAAEELRIKATGESSWMASQQARLSEILVNVAANAKTSKSLAEDENRTRIKFWAEVAQQADLSEKQITEARAQGNRARLALAGEELRGGEQAARQALADRLAALSEQQAANHDDYAKVMQIEQQKLALLASAGKDGTRQYEQELIKRDELARQHATQQAEIARNAIAKERASDAAELAQAKALMDVEVSAERMTKAEEERALQAYANAQQAIEIEAQQAYIDLVRNQPKEYQAALDQMSTMKAQFAARDAQFNARMAADQKATWDRMTAPIDNAISGQVSGVMRGTQTIGMAVNKMAADVVISYAQMAAKAGLHWVGLQLMQILWTGTTEATKTALTQGGAAARIAINNAETASGNSGLLIRVARWIAAELGLTAATTAQAGARTAVQTGADAEAMVQTSLANVAEAQSYAAVGAAAAGASVAAIPVTGWAMAPGVAAATYGELSAYGALASFAVGAWDLPRDMPANLHAGEMVVPANFADGIRGAMSGGGGSGGGQTLNYAPNIRGGGADMAGALRQQSAQFKSYLWHATRNGALGMRAGR